MIILRFSTPKGNIGSSTHANSAKPVRSVMRTYTLMRTHIHTHTHTHTLGNKFLIIVIIRHNIILAGKILHELRVYGLYCFNPPLRIA